MQKSISVKKALIIGALACILISSAVAAFLISHKINVIMVVKPTVSMGVFNIDGSTPLTSIDMGQFQWGTIKYFPTGLETPPTVYYFVNNTDQMSFYVSFTWSNLPPDSNLGYGFWIKRGDQAAFTFVADGQIYNLPIESNVVNPDPATQYAVWYFDIEVASAPFGTYTPTLTVNAYNSAGG